MYPYMQETIDSMKRDYQSWVEQWQISNPGRPFPNRLRGVWGKKVLNLHRGFRSHTDDEWREIASCFSRSRPKTKRQERDIQLCLSFE